MQSNVYMCKDTNLGTLHGQEFVSESGNTDVICGDFESRAPLFPEHPGPDSPPSNELGPPLP